MRAVKTCRTVVLGTAGVPAQTLTHVTLSRPLHHKSQTQTRGGSLGVSFWERELSHLEAIHKAPLSSIQSIGYPSRASWNTCGQSISFVINPQVLFSAAPVLSNPLLPEDSPARLFCHLGFPQQGSMEWAAISLLREDLPDPGTENPSLWRSTTH